MKVELVKVVNESVEGSKYVWDAIEVDDTTLIIEPSLYHGNIYDVMDNPPALLITVPKRGISPDKVREAVDYLIRNVYDLRDVPHEESKVSEILGIPSHDVFTLNY